MASAISAGAVAVSASTSPLRTLPEQAEPETNDDEEESLLLKEGFLVKQGHFRRNWKRRWFELSQVELGRRHLLLTYYDKKGGQEKVHAPVGLHA